MKTKGALIWEFNQPWSIEEIEIGDPVKDEVKIQMEASGMCHSDHHLVTGDIPMAGFPVLGGHEGAGIVVEVGPGVDHIAVGDHVVLSFIPSCGKCPSCQAGLRNLCDLGAGLLAGTAISDGTHRITANNHTTRSHGLQNRQIQTFVKTRHHKYLMRGQFLIHIRRMRAKTHL